MATDSDPDLQQRITRHLRNWSVEVEYTSETETSVLLFGRRAETPVVLKVVREPGDEWHSGEVLAAFGGRGVARVYECAEGAVLLERLSPGIPLAQLALAGQDDEATDILAEVIAAMSPESPRPGTASVLDWAAGFERYAAATDARIPRDLLAEAQRVYLELSGSQAHIRLLHGDLQHYNVLCDARRGWLAIDPKGVVGELEFELGALLRNPVDRPDWLAQAAVVDRRLTRLTAKLRIDRRRALRWGFAQGVLSAVWTVEDGFPLDARNPGLSLARTIRPMLDRLD